MIQKNIEHLTSTQRLLCAVVRLAILFAIGSYAAVVPAQTQPQDDPELLAAYNAAIVDAAVFRFSNLRPLYPLTFDPATNLATVVTITDRPGYRKGPMMLEGEVWVTPDAEVKNLCQNFTGDLMLRLKQLLGLHPRAIVTHAVRMTVRRTDVFRPAFDPETTTTFPCACPVTAKCGLEFPSKIEGDLALHMRWISDKTFTSFVISESTLTPRGYSYPWTRLGYTYDWRPGSNKYGASEYVVRKGSTVTILEEPISLLAYCRPN